MRQLAAYLKDRDGIDSIINEWGFAIYKITGDECYLRDVWVDPDYRKRGLATDLADDVTRMAIAKGCKFIRTSIFLPVSDPTASAKCIFSYGFKIEQILQGGIIFRKDL